MAMDYCRQCNKAFDRIGSNVLCFRCQETERKEYQRIYKLISPTLHRLDYFSLAEKIDANPSKLREVLLFRLGSGQVKELSEHKKSMCYLCEKKQANKENIEPLCITCLKGIESVLDTLAKPKETQNPSVRKIHDKTSQDNSSADKSFETGLALEQALQKNLDAAQGSNPTTNCPCCGNLANETVCKTCYTQVVAQLKWYRKYYGEIPQEELVDISQALAEASADLIIEDPLNPTASVEAPLSNSENVEPEAPKAKSTEDEQSIDDVLKILEMDESDPNLLAGENDDMEELMDFSKADDDTKKFGFKRIKLK